MNEFFRCVLESNPFARSVVGEAADAAVHVEAVHQSQFQELVACVEDVRTTGGCQGKVVWGEAGTGKSHLLVQLDRWARRQDSAFCPIVRHLDANAGSQPWNIVKSVLRQMTRDSSANCPLAGSSACPLVHVCSCRSSETPPSADPTQAAHPVHGGVSLAPWRQMPLFRLVRGAVEQALAELPERSSPHRAGRVLHVFHRLVGRQLTCLNGSAHEASVVCDLLFRFFLAAQRNRQHPGADHTAVSAVKCLSGDPLDLGQAIQLGVYPPDLRQQSVSLSQVATAQTVLLALAELAALSDRALVLCFDQVDELPPEQVGALARFLDPLVVYARNLMVVLSGQQQSMLDLANRGAIDPSAWEHLNPDRSEILLSRIPSAEAKQILQARLRRFVEPFLTLPKLRHRVEQDPLFPLGSDWFADRIAKVSQLGAREAIHLACERWRQQQAKLVDVGGQAWLEEKEEGKRGKGEGTGAKGYAEIPVGAGVRPGHVNDRRSPVRADPAGPASDVTKEKGEEGREKEAGSRENRQPGKETNRRGQSPRSPLPSPVSPPSTRHLSRLQEVAGWSTSAVLVVAIVLVLWARSTGLMEADRPAKGVAVAVAVGRDKRSAVPPGTSPAEGGTALRLSHPTATTATVAAGEKTHAIKDDADNDNDSQGDLDAAVPESPPADPPVVVARTQILAAPAASKPAPSAVARAPPTRGTPNVGRVSNMPVPGTQRHVGNVPSNLTPLVPPAPLAASVSSGRPAVPSATTAATDITSTAENVPAAAAAQSQPSSLPNSRRRAVRFGQTAGGAAAVAGATNSLAAQSPVKPLAVNASPEVERLLDEAWGLIERGDLGPGRTRLLTARKADPADLRADFSLGLLDALTKQDWDSAAKHFTDCLHRNRENIPTLNNLAIVLVQDKREGEAAKHWKAIVSQQPATAEVVQNVGIVRHLMDEGMLRKNNSLRQSLEHLYTEAAVATKTTVQPQTGFRFMALALTDGRSVGFSNPKKMQLAAWSPAPEPSPSARPAGPQPAARGPGAASAGSQPSQPGPTGAVPAAANARQMPAANVNLSPAANAPYVRRPAFGYPTR